MPSGFDWFNCLTKGPPMYAEQYTANNLKNARKTWQTVLDQFARVDYKHVDEYAAGMLLSSDGSFINYDQTLTPFWTEPQRLVTSRDYRKLVVVSGQRISKTASMITSTLLWAIEQQPADAIVMFASQDMSHRYSTVDFAGALTANRGAGRLNIGDAIYHKRFKGGNHIVLAHPSVQQLRMLSCSIAIGSEIDSWPPCPAGDWVTLLSKRVQVAGSRGKTILESPSSAPITLSWEEADDYRVSEHGCYPSASGTIASEYSSSDKRRWYVPCSGCGQLFRMEFKHLSWQQGEDVSILKSAESARLVCPHCGNLHENSEKYDLNLKGRWLREGELDGNPVESRTAGFWLSGVASPFMPWSELVTNYLTARKVFTDTGDMGKWQAVVSSDIGEQFILPADYRRDTAPVEDVTGEFEQATLHPDVRLVFATVDQQIDRFAVGIFGFDSDGGLHQIDRLDLTEFEGKPVRPGEDYSAYRVLDLLLNDRYEYPGNGASLPVSLVSIDANGVGLSHQHSLKWCRDTNARQGMMFAWPLMGNGNVSMNADWVTREATRASKEARIRIHQTNSNRLKDQLHALIRNEGQGGRVRFHTNYPPELLDELQAERRTTTGWFKPRKRKNEQLDLSTMALALLSLSGAVASNWRNLPPVGELPAGKQQPHPNRVI
jgi:phage terminase large subunit GpA-like protein